MIRGLDEKDGEEGDSRSRPSAGGEAQKVWRREAGAISGRGYRVGGVYRVKGM